ncbi:hypothetical protein ACH50O_11800 [Methylomonas sp. 2BW1-5-20]|uniref:hypothetical protein n=1 Tax=Methylomonas sp. 2BW1-5-20 TaxID=3376686 RepID=UPI00404FEC87
MSHGRKPAHLEFKGGKSPRQLIWEKIRELKRFEFSDLVGNLPGTIHRDTTRGYVKALVLGEFLARVSDDVALVDYELIKDNGVEAPRVRRDGTPVDMGRKQENLWRTLRTIGRPVRLFELSALAATEAHPISPAFANDYARNLHHAGYLSKTEDKYQLIPSKNTGPRPPMIQRIKQVYDPNLGKVVWSETKGDDDER